MNSKIMVKTFFLVLLCFFSFGFTYNIIPEGLPKGLPPKIKGNFRLIEHDTRKTMWSVYDFKKWKKISDGVMMYPPIYSYIYVDGKWLYLPVLHEPYENEYDEELVTIINPKEKMRQPPPKAKEGKQISASKAKSILTSSLENKIWTLKSSPYKGGILICGYNDVMPQAIAVWWCKGDKIYNVNGFAKSNTKKFDTTYDLDRINAFDKCNFETRP